MNQPRLRHGILRVTRLAFFGCMAMASLFATGTQAAVAQTRESSHQIAWIREIVSRIETENPPAAIVQLRNQEVLEGYVVRMGIESFAVQEHDGTVRVIAYDEVMVTEYPDPAADPRDSDAEMFTVIGVAPRRTSSTVYPRSNCKLLQDKFENAWEAWEAAGRPQTGLQVETMLNIAHSYYDGHCWVH